MDTEYRKKWDSLVIKLEVVDRDANTGSEVVHWATHFPVSLLLILPAMFYALETKKLPQFFYFRNKIVFIVPSQYPLFSRDYVYVRRYDVDEENNMMVLVSRWGS